MSESLFPLQRAEEAASQIEKRLGPGCERIMIAGSIRRRVSHVGDMEIVAIPRRETDLIGEPGPSVLDSRLAALLHEERLGWGSRNGPKWKHFYVPAIPGFGLDLFIVTPETWGVQLAIRTGPPATAGLW